MIKTLVALLLAFCPLSSLATTYFLSPTGNDGNSGVSSDAPWLTPNHAVNCGDKIVAAASNAYVNKNLQTWGSVNCPTQDNVAWLQCVTFDGCKVVVNDASRSSAGITVNTSFWGVSGFEVDDTATGGFSLSCFGTDPSNGNVHHVIFANNVANTCPLAAFGGGSSGKKGTDYLAIVGNIAYNAGTTNFNCGSNIDVFSPVASDTAPGTHIFVAGNFSFHSVNPEYENCYDGNGIIFDTFDGSSTPGLAPYTAQAVIENNLSLANGGAGVIVEYNSPNDYQGAPRTGVGLSTVYVLNNTLWGNSTGVGPDGGGYEYGSPRCGEYRAFQIQNTHASGNLLVTNSQQCYGWPFTTNYVPQKPNYALVAEETDNTSTITGNWAYSTYGLGTNALNSPGFSFGVNTTGTDPQLAAPSAPSAPNCTGYADVPHCMAPVVAGFTPHNAAAQAYGYQPPSANNVYDPLFPQWLCNTNLPPGLVTMGCNGVVTTYRGVTRRGIIAR